MKMKQFNKRSSFAPRSRAKLERALGHSLLLIGMVLISLGTFAQNLTPAPDGLVMEKKWVSNDPTGQTGEIWVETYVTGNSVTTHVPTDIILVLDVSGSMSENISSYRYTARPSQGYSYNSYGSSQYYYLHTDGNYYLVERDRQWISGIFNPRYYYWLSYTANGTTYYLSGTGTTTTRPNVQDAGATQWTGVLYERVTVSTQSKIDALKTAVNGFVDIIATDASTYNVDHTISVVKYADDSYYGSEASLTEGNHMGAGGNNNYNYTEVVLNRRDPRNDASAIHNAVNGLRAGGATAADYGMTKANYILAQITDETRSKVVVMFTDGDPTYGNAFETAVANNTISAAYTTKNTYDATVFTVGVFDNPSTNTLNYMSYTSSNYPDAQSMTNPGQAAPGANYFFTAESADGLNDIFTAIATASGAMALPASTIVQDMISPNFELNIPESADGKIFAYAPLE